MNERTKKRAAKHLIYEIEMFAFAWKKLNEKNIDPLTKNSMIESFLVHTSNLFHFFYLGESKRIGMRRDDMIAEDYLPKGKGGRAKFRKNRTPKRYLNSIQKKRNKQLAHLTYARLKMRGWDAKIPKKLEKTVNAFFAALSPETLKWFSDGKKEARQRAHNTA